MLFYESMGKRLKITLLIFCHLHSFEWSIFLCIVLASSTSSNSSVSIVLTGEFFVLPGLVRWLAGGAGVDYCWLAHGEEELGNFFFPGEVLLSAWAGSRCRIAERWHPCAEA